MDNLKKLVVTEVIAVIELMIVTAKEERRKAIEESRHHKGAMESRYDTFKEEAQYLMTAQDLRIKELSSTVSVLRAILSMPTTQKEKIGIYALVEIEDVDDGILATYLILPEGGGVACSVGGRNIFTISVTSPLAQALLELSSESEVELSVGGIKKYFTVVSIS